MADTDLSELEFEFSIKSSDMEAFSDILLEFSGKAIDLDSDDDEPVATLNGHRLDISLARQRYQRLQDLFDSITPEIADLGEHIISNNNCFVECCSKDEGEETPCSSLVYIDELIVKPEYRGRGIGTEMLKRMSQVVDMNRALVALKAVPILDDDTDERTDELKAQLKHFYSKIGFRHGGEHYMVKDARDCYAQRQRAEAEIRQGSA